MHSGHVMWFLFVSFFIEFQNGYMFLNVPWAVSRFFQTFWTLFSLARLSQHTFPRLFLSLSFFGRCSSPSVWRVSGVTACVSQWWFKDLRTNGGEDVYLTCQWDYRAEVVNKLNCWYLFRFDAVCFVLIGWHNGQREQRESVVWGCVCVFGREKQTDRNRDSM